MCCTLVVTSRRLLLQSRYERNQFQELLQFEFDDFELRMRLWLGTLPPQRTMRIPHRLLQRLKHILMMGWGVQCARYKLNIDGRYHRRSTSVFVSRHAQLRYTPLYPRSDVSSAANAFQAVVAQELLLQHRS